MSLTTQKVYVNHVPLDSAVGDYEPRIESSFTDEIYEDEVLGRVSGEKREIVVRLMQGENFLSIAKELGYKESQIYKIKGELAEVYRDLHDTNDWEMVKGVLRLYFLSKLRDLPFKVHNRWSFDCCLKEYRKPSQKMIKRSLEELIIELGGGTILYNGPKIKKRINTISSDQLSLFT